MRNIFSKKGKVFTWGNFRHPNYFKRIGDKKLSSQMVSICVRKIILSPNVLILSEKTYFVTKLLWINMWQKHFLTKGKYLREETYLVTQIILNKLVTKKLSSQNIRVCVMKVVLSPNVLILREETYFVTKLLEINRWQKYFLTK